MALESLHAIVHGEVQGVHFRVHTAREAGRLRLRGWVRNLPDGTVEVQAAGDAASLDALERWLEQGPPAARVLRVDATRKTTAAEPPPGFRITR